ASRRSGQGAGGGVPRAASGRPLRLHRLGEAGGDRRLWNYAGSGPNARRHARAAARRSAVFPLQRLGGEQRSLAAAGFTDAAGKKIPQTWRLPSVDALFEAMQTATVRTAGLLRHQTPEALRSIRVMMRNACGLYQRNGAVELPMPAILAVAKKPGAPKEASR